MKELHTIYLSLGSNEGDRLRNLQLAIFRLGDVLGKPEAVSRVYRTPAWGFEGEEFLNAAVRIMTGHGPKEVLDTILGIEKGMGRTRHDGPGYHSRNIDIDILYYDDAVLELTGLTLPHPKIQDRMFVLRPLADIAPQHYHPVLRRDTRNLLQECRDGAIPIRLAENLFVDRAALFAQTQFIAIEGNIGAGKTSLAQKFAQDFNGKIVLEQFTDNPFLPDFYADQERYAFPLEMAFLADRYKQFVEDSAQFDLFRGFVVSDYDIHKSLIFANVTLQVQEFILYRKIFEIMYKGTQRPKIYLFLYQTTERLLEHIEKRGRPYEKHIAPEYLEKINRGYLDFIKGSPDLPSLVMDTSELDFVSDPHDYAKVVEVVQNYALDLVWPSSAKHRQAFK